MDEKLIKSLEHKLDVLINLNAMLATKDMSIADAAPLLYNLGLTQVEIATILGSTPNAIKTRIAEARKKKKIKK